jgi:uncharacterized repeat protein (TIGR03943 family)
VRRETQNILLVLLGGALLKISFTGAYLRYVRPQHQWLLILAGAVMLTLAVVSIVREIRGRDVSIGHEDHDHPARSAWLLVLPVLAVFLVAPPALGSDSVQRAADAAPRVTSADEGMERYPPLPRGDVVALPLSEFRERAAWDSGHSLDERAIRLTGFVVHEDRDTYLARVAISCCAADAYPIKVLLADGDVPRLPDDSWVQAVVRVQPGSSTKANEYIPSATVLSVRKIAEPADPYEH